MEGTDIAVSVASEENGAISAPGEASAVGDSLVLAGGDKVRAELVNDDLALQIPNLDSRGGGGAQPVTVGGEDEAVDHLSGFEVVKALALIKVPEHGSSVLSSTGAETAVGGDGNGVEVSLVSDKVGAKLAVAEAPDLHNLVPATADNQGNRLTGREADATHPLGVSLVTDGELALSKGVPKLDGLVAAAGDDLPVVSGEGNREDVLGVTNKAAGGLSTSNLPEAKSAVPGSGERELSVRRDNNIGDEVAVALEGLAGVGIGVGIPGQRPDHDRLVTGRREDHVRILDGGGDTGDPVSVPTEGAAKGKSFRHLVLDR